MNLFDFLKWLCRTGKPNGSTAANEAAEPGDSNKKPDPISAGINKALCGPKRPLLYMFQFSALPEAVFQNHPDLLSGLGGASSLPWFVYFLGKAHLRCMTAGLIESGQGLSDDEMRRIGELFKDVTLLPVKVDGYIIYFVTMPPPEFIPEAHLVAIVHKDDEPKEYMQESPSTRYFTLEKSVTPLPVLCECRRDGSRRNYGERVKPELPEFLAAILERLVPD